MSLSALSEIDHVDLALAGDDLEAVLKELFTPVRASDGVVDPDRVWQDLVARQAAGPVALDRDVALPHARTAGVKRITVAAGRHTRGVAFDREHDQVRLIFLILTPKEQPAEYLRLIARLAARLRDPVTRNRLLNTNQPEEFAALLKG